MKLGILGTGNITGRVTPMLMQLPEVQRYAVASRDIEKAEAFRIKYGFEKAYGSYEDLLNDPEVELVYVCSPHSHHFEYMMLCLEHGKNVLCEKPFTVNAKQARQVAAKAREKGLFAAEAMWTRYMPSRTMIKEILDSGVIGEVKTLNCNICFNISQRERLKTPALAGGALLDVGIYGINLAMMHLGTDIERIDSSVQMLATGVDAQETIVLHYKNGVMATITSGIVSVSDCQGVFYGTKGAAIVEKIDNPQSVTILDENGCVVKKIPIPKQINGYEYEFLECDRILREGGLESCSMPLDETARVMEVMDSIRAQWGLVYPMEK